MLIGRGMVDGINSRICFSGTLIGSEVAGTAGNGAPQEREVGEERFGDVVLRAAGIDHLAVGSQPSELTWQSTIDVAGL